MATGWAGDGAVQDQIDATVKDGIARVRSKLEAVGLSAILATHPEGGYFLDAPAIAPGFMIEG